MIVLLGIQNKLLKLIATQKRQIKDVTETTSI